jgi:hypothetical protein
MRFGTWNVRSLYLAGSLMTVAKKKKKKKNYIYIYIYKCKLDLVEVQEVGCERRDTEPASEYTFLYGKGNENHELSIDYFVHKRIISAIKRIEFVSDSMS